METKPMKSNLPQMRRFLAIALTVLSLLGLIWPEAAIVARVSRADYLRDELDDYDSDWGRSKSDVRTEANAEYSSNIVFNRTKLSFSDLRSWLSAEATEIRLVEKADTKDMSGSEKREYMEFYLEWIGPSERAKRAYYLNSSVFVNILFFGLLALGIAAIVFYVLNGTRILGIAYGAFTLLADLFLLILMMLKLPEFTKVVSPGISMLLMPLFAALACVVYQPDKKAKPAAPRRAPRPAPRPAPASDNLFADTDDYAQPGRPAANPFEPAARPTPRPTSRTIQRQADNPFDSAPRAAAAGWVCPKCRSTNRPDAQFCTVCGTQKTAPRAAEPVCRKCGNPLKPGAAFCPNCGERQ